MDLTKKGIFSFILITLLSLLVIFFVRGGLNGFRYGLDLNGGVTLKYLVDYSDYNAIYSGQQLIDEKRSAENIIIKNINNRISALGVSDANVYSQAMNGQEYITVEIGGLQDEKKAIDLIGKTVQIEFKTPFTGTDEKAVAQRENNMLGLIGQLKENPGLMMSLASGKDGDGIFYSSGSFPVAQLPTELVSNLTGIVQSGMGKVYPQPISGSVTDDSGNVQKFWYITKYNGQTSSGNFDTTGVMLYAIEKKLNFGSGQIVTGNNALNNPYISGNQIIAPMGQEFTGQAGYDLVAYKVSTDSGELIKNITSQLQTQNYVSTGVLNTVPEYDGWYGASEISSIKNLTGTAGVYSYVNSGNTYVYKILNSKSPDQYLYQYISLNSSNPTQLVDEIKSQPVYNLEQIVYFQNPTWVTALDGSGRALNAQYFKMAQTSQSQTGEPSVSIMFNDVGKEIFSNISAANIGKQVAIFVGGKLVVAPTIQERITDGTAQITGKYTADQAKELVNELNQGALPAKLTLANQEVTSPILGDGALRNAILAGVVALIAISIFFFVVYGTYYGIVATLAMIAFTLVVLAISKLLGYVFSLSGIAAMILSIGMAVDANVLMFERVKEELASGKSSDHAIDDGANRSYPAIRDGNITNIIIGILLFMLGTNLFKGFGLMVILNVLVTLWLLVPLSKELLHDILPKQK